MPVSFTLNRVTTFRPLTGDQDGDGYADAGDVLRHVLTIHNTGDTAATSVVLNDLLGGSTETGLMNISPIAFDDAFTAVGNTALRVGGAANIGSGPSSQVAGNLLDNDVGSTTVGVGALAADDVTGFTIDTVTNQLTAGGGRYSIFADGSFNYISEAGDTGTDSFSYTIRDAGIDGLAGNSDDTTSTATVTITLTGQVWYVDSAAAGGGTGTSANPFNSITALQAANVDGANDYVYVKGNATGQLVMETGEHLIGQGADLDVAGFHLADDGARSTVTNNAAGFGVTLAGGGTGNNEIAGINLVSTGGAGNHALTGTSFGNLTLNNATIDASGQGLVLSTGTIVAGSTGLVSTDSDGGTNNVSLTSITGTLALGTGALSGATGTAFNVSGGSVSATYAGNVSQASASQALVGVSGGHTGTLTFSTGTLSATNGTGLQFDDADGTYNFNGTNTLNGGDAGVDIINGSIGNFSFSSNSSITNPTGIGFNVNGGNGNIDYNGTISHNTNAQAISIQNHLGGTVSFDGTVSSTGNSDGINLATNTGAIINFTNTLTINTSASNTIGFNATGGGTVTATGSGNTINSGAGIGLNVVNTNIGVNDLHFQSISTNGASSGIVLNNTGTSASFGGLIITGTGANDSGGSILNSTDDGIKLISTRDISLTQLRIFNSTNNNIDANGVTNLTLVSLTSDQTGATNFLGNNITTMSISGSTFDHSGNGATEHGVFITGLFGINSVITTDFHRSAEVQFRVLNTTATVAQGGVAGDILTMSGVTFADHTAATFGDSIQINSDQTANFHFIMNNSSGANSITGGIDGILINASSGGDIDVDISNVTVTNTSGPGINFNPVSTGSRVWFDVHDNTVTNPGSTGINATAIGNNASIEGFITNNTINQGATGNGITIVVEGDGDNTTRPTATISVTGNTITGVQNGSIINAQARVGGIMNLTLNNNHGNVNNALNLEGIFVQAGSSSPADNDADTQNIVRLNMLNNDISVGAASGQEDYRMQVRGTSLFELQDFVGNGNNASITDEVNWITTTKTNGEFNAGDNPPEVQISHTLTGAVTGSFSASAGAIPTPVLPTPLIASGPAPTPADNDTHDDPKSSGNGTGGELPTPDGGGGSTGSGGPAGGQPTVVDDGVLSQAELALIVDAAIDRWAAAGATPEQIAAMRAVTFGVADIAGLSLGMSTAGHITLDSNAAGFSWFIDATPGDDSEYGGEGTRLTAAPGSQAGVRIDLLTTVMHELGHQIGLSDDFNPNERDELMYGTINPGERRLPGNDDLTGASGAPLTGIAFALSPVNLGTIPAGRIVTVQWDSTVNAFTNQIVPTFNNTSSVSGGNFVTVNSNTEVLGPNGTPTPTFVVLDSLTLGNLVFNDANNNGMFDGSDTGINGVALTLFADTNANGVFDSGIDVQLGTTTTAGGGLYSFANLAPGDYIVRVDAANFTVGGALVNRVTAIGGSDPDNNTNDDDNGVNGAGGIVVGQAITLTQNGETTADGTGQLDINNTLDFGFVQINQPPVNTVPGTQTINEDATLTFTGGTAISVNDPDVGAGNLTVTLSVVNGQLTLSGTAGLAFGAGDGTDDTTMTFTGTQAAVNAALAGLLYETTLDYNGSDLLTIVTNDNGNTGADPGTSGGANDEEDTDTVTINITAVADIVTDTPTVGEDSGTNNLDLLGNDTFENPGRSITSVTQGLHGFVAINDNNTIGDTTDDFVTYTPAGDYNGADSFTYTVTSGGVTEVGTVNVTITAVADIADDSPTTAEDTAVNVLVQANDTFENAGHSITNVGAALHGTAVLNDAGTPGDATDDYIVYTPDPDYNGSDSFTYQVTSGGVTETATVNVTVTAVADIADDSVGVVQDSVGNALDLLANDTFEDSGRAITAVGAALHGTTAIDDNGTAGDATDDFVTYTPTGGYTGPDSFTYTVTSGGVMETATVTVNVAPANLAPVVDLNTGTGGIDDTNLYVEDGSPSGIGTTIDVTDADAGDNIESATITITDPEAGDLLSVTLPLPPGIMVDTVNSTATTLILIGSATPAAYAGALGQVGYSSSSSDPTDGGTNTNRLITVVVNDGTSDSAAATMTMTVADVNDEPTLVATGLDPTYTENGAAVDLFSGVTVTTPEGGQALTSLTLTVSNVTDGASEILSFDGSDVALTNGNSVLTATNGLTVNVTVSSGTATVSFSTASLTPAQVNTLVDAMTYRNASENPTDADRVVTITQLVDDGSSVSPNDNSATLSVASTVNVNPVNDAANITGDAAGDVTEAGGVNNGTAGTPTDTGDLDSTDVDNPNDAWQAVLAGGTTISGYGTYALTAAGVWTYTLDDGNAAVQALHGAATLTDTFNAVTADGTAQLVTITIHAQDDAPVIQPDAVTTDEATLLNGNVFNDNGSGADADPDSALTVSAVNGSGASVGMQITLASGAKLTVNTNGTFAYDPNHAFDATPTGGSGASNTPAHDSFDYTLAGGGTATVSVTVTGLDTDDELFGTAGLDMLSGGGGNDLYHVDNSGDLVFENNGAGNDRILTSASFALGGDSFVETLEAVAGIAAINLTGNYMNNTLIGNAGANMLHGAGGVDTLIGLGGNDVYFTDVAANQVIEATGGGSDQLYTSVSYVLGSAEIELLSTNSHAATTAINLTGNNFNQTLLGNAGANMLHGGGGTDTLIGYGGNDVYYTDVAATQALEAVGGGSDQLYSSVSYTLTAGSEIELLSTNNTAATAAINLTGNDFANAIFGNAGVNTLDGKGGNDDLIGLAGADTFAFTSALGANNVDRIHGYEVGIDKIALDHNIFTGLGVGPLAPGAFVVGTAAGDADDRIIYDQANGSLYFDADGNGAGAAVLFAHVAGGTVLAASDFSVI